MKNLKTSLVLTMALALGACASSPGPNQSDKPIVTMEGYSIAEARTNFSITPDPYDIPLSACYTEDGQLIMELHRLRLRMQNDYNHRATKQFKHEYNQRVLYPIDRR